MTQIIAVLSPKGGTGKSTVARLAAVAYAAANWDVAVMDSDPTQETSRQWFERRLDNPKLGASNLYVTRAKGVNPIKNLMAKDEPDLIIIDGCPRSTDASAMYAKQANLILIPTGTSVDDLMPSIKFAIQLVAAHGVDRERIRFILNHCSRNKREVSQAIEAILGAGLKVMGAMLNESPCYRSALDEGKAPNEVPYFIPRNRAQFLAESIGAELAFQQERN